MNHLTQTIARLRQEVNQDEAHNSTHTMMQVITELERRLDKIGNILLDMKKYEIVEFIDFIDEALATLNGE